ncbi:MAG: transcriptional repressor LexA [Bacilli bacterium]
MEKLTVKQEKVLRELKKYIAKNGYPPTVRELCALTKLKSTATIHVHLEQLAIKGYIRKDKDRNRTIEILVPNEYDKKTDTIVSIPLVGKVTAGNPIEAIERPGEYFDVPASILNPKKETFSLNVSGDSMINVGIHDNDIVLVEKTKIAKNGDIVVAMNEDNEATVKTFYKEKDHIRLQPENDALEPIILNNVTILGKVVGLYRKI